MYTETQIKRLVKQRIAIAVPLAFGGIVAMFGYLGVLAIFRNQIVIWGAERLIPFMAMGCLLPFLCACWIADRHTKRFVIVCPQCSKDLALSAERILKTRACIACGRRVLKGGKLRDSKTYSRYSQRRGRSFLVYWFWSWPLLGATVLVVGAIWPDSVVKCPHVVFLFGAIGTFATGWTLLRTFDHRYVFQTVASAVVFVLGIRMFLA